MLTFARSKLLLKEEEFWDMAPKQFFAMEREWYRIMTIERTGQFQPFIDYDEADKLKLVRRVDPTLSLI